MNLHAKFILDILCVDSSLNIEKKSSFNKRKFLHASSFIRQRGPDEEISINYKNISTTFYRLSIRDLSKKGSQPMWDRSR